MTLRTNPFICLLAPLIISIGCHRGEEPTDSLSHVETATPGILQLDADAQKRLGIALASVRRETVCTTIPAIGWLEAPPASQTIIRAPVAGFAVMQSDQKWPVLGQEVASGDTLAQLNVFLSPQEVSQLVQTKEDNDILMQQALVTMELSEAQLKLVSAARDAVTGVRVDQVKEAFLRSKAAYKEAQDKVPFLIQEPYENGVLVKPVRIEVSNGGRILHVHCAAGQFVQGGDSLWTIADWSTLWLRVPVFDGDAQRIDPSQAAKTHDRSGLTTANADPVTVPTETKSGTRTVDFYYKLTNSDWKLRVGQSIAVDLPTSAAEPVLLIPSSGVLYDGFGQASCYAAEADRTEFRRQRIELGSRHADSVVVLRGLDSDDFVVSIGAEQLAAEESKSELSVEDDD